MTILASILLILLTLIAYLLFMPVTLNLHYAIDEKSLRKSSIKLFPFEYRFKAGKPGKKTPGKQKAQQPKVEKPRGKRVDFADLIGSEYKTFKVIIISAGRLIAGIARAPKVEDLTISLRGGFPDPDITGIFYGGVMAAGPLLAHRASIIYLPDFQADRLGGFIRAKLAIRLCEIAKELLIFIWRLPKLRIIKIYLRFKKGG